MKDTISQRGRLTILGLYIAFLFVVSKVAFGTWLPPSAEKGLWFYSGLAALLLGSLLVTPFFTKPVDAISYGVAAIIALSAVGIWPSTGYSTMDKLVLWMAVVYVLFVIIAGIVSIVTRTSESGFWQSLSKSLYYFCDDAGTARAVFSVVFIFALIAFHRNSARECTAISLAWAIMVGLQPLEAIARLLDRISRVWRKGKVGKYLGDIVGHETPGVILVRHDKTTCVPAGKLLIARADDGQPGLALALDYVGLSDGLWLRAIHFNLKPALRDTVCRLLPTHSYPDEAVICLDEDEAKALELSDKMLQQRSGIVGLVAPNTDISHLRFEVLRTDIDLEEGRLVEVEIDAEPVLYQIVNGLTKEEIIHEKNTRGFVQAEAKKIGSWRSKLGRFEIVKWVPQPNSPVFLVTRGAKQTDKDAVGHFPDTPYPVTIDCDLLTTHNTAILGILGAGKSFLALELVERMIKAGIKVICFDLTNQYAKQLEDYYDVRRESRRMKALQKIGPRGRTNATQNVEEGGSVQHFKFVVHKYLDRFLDPKTKDSFVVVNPAAFEVWRQDSKPFQGKASMASLTPCEITRVFTEATLEAVQSQGMTDQARCCLVFEEAHSLIPEWNAVASEGDKTATNGTAKAILQGRKYGLGCLVITQRTANVTKSILNQCNTVFALRVFDATGMEFLKNYIGEDYAGVLSTLEDRHAVVFGRASSCSNPVLIRLNDREDFINAFRGNDGQEESP